MAAAAQAPEAKPFLALPVLWLNSGQAAQKKAARTNPTRQTKEFNGIIPQMKGKVKMEKYYFDRSDGSVYELPSTEERLAREQEDWDMNEDKYMDAWRDRMEEYGNAADIS